MLNFLPRFVRDRARSVGAEINHAQIAATIEREGIFDAPTELQPRAIISESDLVSLPSILPTANSAPCCRLACGMTRAMSLRQISSVFTIGYTEEAREQNTSRLQTAFISS